MSADKTAACWLPEWWFFNPSAGWQEPFLYPDGLLRGNDSWAINGDLVQTGRVLSNVYQQTSAGNYGNLCTDPRLPTDWSAAWTGDTELSIIVGGDGGPQMNVSYGDTTSLFAQIGLILNAGDIAAGHAPLAIATPGGTLALGTVTGVNWTNHHTLTMTWDGAQYHGKWDGVLVLTATDAAIPSGQAISTAFSTFLLTDKFDVFHMDVTQP